MAQHFSPTCEKCAHKDVWVGSVYGNLGSINAIKPKEELKKNMHLEMKIPLRSVTSLLFILVTKQQAFIFSPQPQWVRGLHF